jgi:hypothetical protein
VPLIDDIPWRTLKHAYGPAIDVPDLLQKLRSQDSNGEALSALFSTIWHQGTVYEATGYAVPFLVELAADESTPNRVGILNLLAAISHGTSYLDVHEDFFKMKKVEAFGGPGTPKYESKRSQELVWVQMARNAVIDAFDQFMTLAMQSGDLAYAASAVLVRLKTRRHEVQAVISNFLIDERRDLYRAGLLLLIGQLRYVDDDIWKTLTESANSGDQLERLASGLTACRLEAGELPSPIRKATIEAMCTTDVEYLFDELPWDASGCVDLDNLKRRPKSEVDEAVAILFKRVESGESITDSIYLLLDLLFPIYPETKFTSKDQFSENQLRLLNCLLEQFDNNRLHLNVDLMQYGLPESRRSLRTLLTGVRFPKLDELYPSIAYANNPLRPRRVNWLKVGDRIHSRNYGLGTVTKVERERLTTSIQVDFDEEGLRSLWFKDSLIAYLIDLGCYWLIAIFGKRPK